MASIEVIEVTTMLSGVDNSFVATNHPDVILYEVILGLGHISQIVSRMYLKYVKKIQDSNEIFTKYFVIIICILDLSPMALVFLQHELILKIAYYILDILLFVLHPASMILFHNGLNDFFFSKHTKLKQFVEHITELLQICGIYNAPPLPEDIPSLDPEEADPYSDKSLTAMANQAANRLNAAKLKLEQEKPQNSQNLHPKKQTTISKDCLPMYPKHRGVELSDVECL